MAALMPAAVFINVKEEQSHKMGFERDHHRRNLEVLGFGGGCYILNEEWTLFPWNRHSVRVLEFNLGSSSSGKL